MGAIALAVARPLLRLFLQVFFSFLADLIKGWQRDQAMKAAGAAEAERRGQDEIARRTAAADAAAARARADHAAGVVHVDPNRRD